MCTVTVPSHPAESRHVCVPRAGAVLGERVGLKGSLFPRVIIPEQRNRNVLKTPRWTFLTGAGPFGCTVAPLFPSMCLEQPDHLLHPPLPQNNQPVIKKQVFSLQYWAKCPEPPPYPGLAGRRCGSKGRSFGTGDTPGTPDLHRALGTSLGTRIHPCPRQTPRAERGREGGSGEKEWGGKKGGGRRGERKN